MEEVLRRMQLIRDLFMETQSFCMANNDLTLIQHYLQQETSPYCSVAYESAAMHIAVKNAEESKDIKEWIDFANSTGKAHQAQVYVGLGWAIAKMKASSLPFALDMDALLQYYMADGCGYYDGCFRQRQTILNQQLPDYLPANLLPKYDQGIGRSLWYTYEADIDRIKSKIDSFSSDRQSSFWRGLGIAIAYIGGCDDKVLKNIFDNAGEHAEQLVQGSALVLKSRIQAGTATDDTGHCERTWATLAADAGKN